MKTVSGAIVESNAEAADKDADNQADEGDHAQTKSGVNKWL
jgi:hypothetical protein